MKTIREALEKGIVILKEAYKSSPAEKAGLLDMEKTGSKATSYEYDPVFEAGLLLCEVIKKDRVFIYTHGESILEQSKEQQYLNILHERASGKPLQYITGHREFMSLEFEVTPGVLIPRQDTEVLVETAIRHARSLNREALHILDLGTGSGCIAVCLAYYIEGSLLTAVDISAQALAVAARNASAAGVMDRITFIEGNMSDLLFDCNRRLGIFDTIVSNPPYIPTRDMAYLQREVRDFEPLTALDGGMDGLGYYRIIIEGSVNHLAAGGMLAFEVGIGQANDVAMLMEPAFEGIRKVKDLSGIERVVYGLRRGTIPSRD